MGNHHRNSSHLTPTIEESVLETQTSPPPSTIPGSPPVRPPLQAKQGNPAPVLVPMPDLSYGEYLYAERLTQQREKEARQRTVCWAALVSAIIVILILFGAG